MTTLRHVELGVLGPLQVRQHGLPVAVPGAKPRAVLTMLGLHGGSVVSADTLAELLWGARPPRTAVKALQTHISALRRALGDGFVLTEGTGWALSTTDIDATRYKVAARLGRDAIAAGDASQAVARFDEALSLWRGIPELPDGPRAASEKTRWIEGHAALVEDRADALLATGRAAEIVGELEAAIADAPLRERRWGQLMLALYRAGRQGEALAAYQRARSLLADELGVDPGPNLRRLEAAIVSQDPALEIPVSQQLSTVTKAVTFLLTDIEGSTAAWEAQADAMTVALARHDEIIEQVVTSRGGRLVKTRGEGDATFSVFDRPSAAAAAAIELQEAIRHEPWALANPVRIRVALHTGEVELRDGDYFGRAVNRAARLRSLAAGGQILCSGATAELVIDTLSDDVILDDLGRRQLKNLARPEHVFELRLETADDSRPLSVDAPMERPALPAVLTGPGPFVGRSRELAGLLAAWQSTLAAGTRAVLIAGEPGVGKTRLAGEWSRRAYEQAAVVLYGRCDEDLGAAYQPFAEALRSLVPCLDASRLRKLRGVEALLALVPGLTDVLPDLAAPTRADPDTERYALFDAVVALLGVASTNAPVVLILDDLHWAEKPTLLLLRHLLRFGEHARVQIVGTYRNTDLDRSHPLAAMLADLHRDGSASRLALSGLDEDDVTAYVAEAGYDDEELARALSSVTGGNPFFLIEALRHVDESGGRWDPSTLPQGVREAVSRRLSRLPAETNKALAAAAVVGSRFALDLVERVVDDDLVDAFDEACKAGIVIEEPGGHYRFNHAIVRQSLLAELASVRRMRLHQRIATTLETEPGADDELLAELAYHYFECAWAGNAAKAVEYCRRAADQAMARLAYEGAADLYDKALHALEELDEELPDRNDLQAELLVARCEALLAAGEVVSATGAVSQLQAAAGDSARLAAWGTCFDGQLSMLTDPERLDEIESAVRAAAEKLAGLDDAAGEAKAHTVRAGCLARLGRIGDCETALDQALTAARRAGEHRRVNAVLAGAPLAALWGPNPVPRAGGRCLDVVRLLRITTGSPVVEATSTRCQAVLDALRGRAGAGRNLLDSARRTLTELGMRHALLEVDQFAGTLELVADDPAAAEPHLRRAYNGFRRMGLDADTAETAALLARACLALGRDAEADELCTESERLAGHALKASIAWRTVRAQLLARGGANDEARRVAKEAVTWAERTDLLVDHGDACLALATVLNAAGDAARALAAAEQAVGLYEQKGAAALVEKARSILGEGKLPTPSAPTEASIVKPENACVRAIRRLDAAVDRKTWGEYEALYATDVVVESRRKVVGVDLPTSEWPSVAWRLMESGTVHRHVFVAVRGERLALTRVAIGTADVSAGAPVDEVLGLYGVNESGRIALAVWFDVEDLDAAVAELDAAHARFEEAPLRARLENAASQLTQRFWTYFLAHDWEAVTEILADDTSVEDRRPVVNYGLLHGPDSVIEALRAHDMGVAHVTPTVVATRGERLAFVHTRFASRDQRSEAFQTEQLDVVEIDTDHRITAIVVFDRDDIHAAIAELDARYLAGEAAAHAQTWSVIAGAYAALDRHELPATTPDWVNIDHQHVTSFAPGELFAAVRASWDLVPDLRPAIEAVHRLSNLGAVVTHMAYGTSQHGFDAEWRQIGLLTVEGDLINRIELFDEAELDTALARLDELARPAPQLENAASRVDERFNAYLAARDWVAMAKRMTDDISIDDRRRAVASGFRHGRDAEIANMRAIVDLGVKSVTSTVIATRGEHLLLSRVRWSGPDKQAEAFHTDALAIVEINTDDRIAARVVFDLDDIDAAFEELDARYLAGEAAAFSQTWSTIAGAHAAINKHVLPATTPDVVNVDHRRIAMFAPGDLIAFTLAALELERDICNRIETVHRLNEFGCLVTRTSTTTSQEEFDAEWRVIDLVTVQGDLINRFEMFDEADLDAALAKFDELSRPAPQLENAASQVYDRLNGYFAARDWAAMAETIADDMIDDDRRRVVNGGVRHGRDAEIANLRTAADLGAKNITATAVATRGDRLALCRLSFSGQGPEAFQTDALGIVAIDTNDQFVAHVLFDLDDIDSAFAELDARYLAGEAAPYARVWQSAMDTLGEANRHEPGPILRGLRYVDHRRVSFGSADFGRAVEELWALVPDARYRVTAVRALDAYGTVASLVIEGTDSRGNELQWSRIVSFVPDEPRMDVYEDDDVDAALAQFEELRPHERRLENAASRVVERYLPHFADRDWGAMADKMAHDISTDDRRRVVNAGIRHGRDAEIANMQAAADIGITYMTSIVIATRGEHLILTRTWGGRDQGPEEFLNDVLGVVEINPDNQIAAIVVFDLDDVDAAFEELDARYLAGEAAPHARTWSLVTGAYAAVSGQMLPPTTQDWVNIDHRRVPMFAPGDLIAFVEAAWALERDSSNRVESVHRLNEFGAVLTRASSGTSHAGFDAEWREVDILTVKGDLISSFEVFDNADVEAALARFEELSRPAPRLENAASRIYARYRGHFAARDWAAMAELLTDDTAVQDHRRVVNDEARCGRDVEIANMRAVADIGARRVTSAVVAVRGEHLALCRNAILGEDEQPGAFRIEFLSVVEINADEHIVARDVFDADDIEAAFDELDARHLAGEAAPHAHAWSVVMRAYAAVKRHELPAWTSDSVNIDHRRATAFAPGELTPYLHATWDQTPDVRVYVEAVHRLTSFGALVTHVANGTSHQGFEGEWREVTLSTIEGDWINRSEMFDEADLDAALARFEELQPQTLRLKNAAIRTWARAADAFNRRDLDGYLAHVNADGRYDDRRKGLRALHQGPARQLGIRAVFEAPKGWRQEVEPIAIRGPRLSLTRDRFRDTNDVDRPITLELLTIAEVDDDDRLHDTVHFDPDDIEAAFEELDARYLAGEAADHAKTWSLLKEAYAAFNRRELPPTTPDWANIDRRRGAGFASGDAVPYVLAAWEVAPDVNIYIEAVHRLSNLGAVLTYAAKGTSTEGFDAEWREITILTFEGDVISRCEIFDEADLDAALARFDELNPPAPRIANATTRQNVHIARTFNHRDLEGYLGIHTADARYDDRRKGLRNEGPISVEFGHALFSAVAQSWRLEIEPIAIRGDHLAVSRNVFRDTAEADRPITVEASVLTEATDDGLLYRSVIFDPDDINGAMAELTARWISSEEVAHPEVIEAARRLNEIYSRHDWDEMATLEADATYVNHRQLANGDDETIIDHWRSIRALATLVPDLRTVLAEVIAHSATGIVSVVVVNGCTAEGSAIELPNITLVMFDGARVRRMEVFDFGQRDQALARFEELNRSG